MASLLPPKWCVAQCSALMPSCQQPRPNLTPVGGLVGESVAAGERCAKAPMPPWRTPRQHPVEPMTVRSVARQDGPGRVGSKPLSVTSRSAVPRRSRQVLAWPPTSMADRPRNGLGGRDLCRRLPTKESTAGPTNRARPSPPDHFRRTPGGPDSGEQIEPPTQLPAAALSRRKPGQKQSAPVHKSRGRFGLRSGLCGCPGHMGGSVRYPPRRSPACSQGEESGAASSSTVAVGPPDLARSECPVVDVTITGHLCLGLKRCA